MVDLLPEQLPPEQATPNTVNDMDVKVTCTPPLGQATIIPQGQDGVDFSVLLETSSKSTDEAEVLLWHNFDGEHKWSSQALQTSSASSAERSDNILFINGSHMNSSASRRWFTTYIPTSHRPSRKVSFTLQYRSNPKESFQWIKDSTGLRDGEIYFQTPITETLKNEGSELSSFFSDISHDIKVEKQEPETNGDTQLWSLTCSVNPAKGQDSGYQHHRLGKPKKGEKWMALVRLWSPWLAPRHGECRKFEVDKDGVLLSFLRSDGLHVVCLAISGIQDVLTTFIKDENGNVEIKGRNDREETGTSRVLVAVADSFEVANCAVMYCARKIVAHHPFSKADDEEIAALTDEKVKPEWIQEWWDGLTYCTWNGLGQALTAQKIYDALDELKKNDINITNLIIDDNWQSLSSGDSQFKRGWSDFEANSTGFPDGMKKATHEIRKRHPNVNHIAVWHAILGYWGGIDPNGKIAKKYKTIEVEKEPGVAGGTFTVVAAEDARQMYLDFYAFLKESGIDAVKTDAQFFLDMLVHAPDRRNLINEYQDAWTIAHLRHFSSRAISCMSQFPQSLFHSQLPRNKPRLLVRNSDDFFPEVEASHAWHIFCNAHNSLFTQHLNALPDWDMFQTSHDWASFHGAARCVSGGPIYITDKPGEHDIKLIRAMTAQTVQGKTTILRPQMIGRTVGSVYNSYDSKAILKIGTFVGRKGTGTGILGCFNVSSQTLSEFVHLEDFPGTDDSVEYVLGSFNTGQVSRPMKRGGKDAVVHHELGKRECDIVSAYALQSFPVHAKDLSVACMGLLGKMTGSAAVANSDFYVETNGRLRIWVSLKALGVLGLWISDLREKEVEDDFMVMIFGKPVPSHCVGLNEACDRVLEIDVETAWKEMDLEAGWSNEVAVEVFVG